VGRISVYDYVEDVREVSTALGNPILVGHSMGGLLVQKLAESCNPPAVVAITPGPPRGICALSTAMLVRTAIRHADAILLSRPLLLSWQEANRLTLNGLPCDEQAQVYERLTPESGRAALEVALLGVDVNESRFRCPMLLIAAGKDNTTPAKMVGKIARRYKVECRTYSDHGHMIIMEPGWERVARDMADWLNRVLKLRETQGGLP
jgi:pimeloyl-ACP methyl ester carboxylesterase